MERLVEQAYGIAQIIKAGTAYNGKKCYNTCEDICKRQDYKCNEGCPIQAVISRLSDYQDTGLTPEEVSELAQAKQDGRIIPELPQDMENLLEPLKLQSALSSEMRKLEFRKANRPKDISILDYTIIAALSSVLKQAAEAEKGRREINDIT